MNVELLLRIKQLILEEPKRVRMASWSSNVVPVRPQCDTVACIFGWAVALDRVEHGQGSLSGGCNILKGINIDFLECGGRLLKLNPGQASRLAFVNQWPDQFKAVQEIDGIWWGAAWPLIGKPAPQTQEYAEIVARRIDHFIATEGRE